MVACVAMDQYTKFLAGELLKGTPVRDYFGGLFRFEYAENTGAFLSMGSTLPDPIRFLLLSVLVAVLLAVIVYFLFARTDVNRWTTLALSLLAGGGISNLIDRFTRPGGHVVDFMNMGIGSLRTGIFNIADIAITSSVFILLFQNFRNRPSKN